MAYAEGGWGGFAAVGNVRVSIKDQEEHAEVSMAGGP